MGIIIIRLNFIYSFIMLNELAGFSVPRTVKGHFNLPMKAILVKNPLTTCSETHFTFHCRFYKIILHHSGIISLVISMQSLWSRMKPLPQ